MSSIAILNSTIKDNYAYMGGGIAFSMDEESGISTQTLSRIDNSTIIGNTALRNGGGVVDWQVH